MHLSEQGHEDPDVNRAFYEQSPRSRAIRNLTLKCIAAYKRALFEQSSESESDLRKMCQELGRLGVTADMHVVDANDPDAEEKARQGRSDPVVASEWIAGQLLDHLQGKSPNQGFSAKHVVGEHDELLGAGHGDMYVFDLRTADASLADDAVSIALSGWLEYMLVAEEGFDTD